MGTAFPKRLAAAAIVFTLLFVGLRFVQMAYVSAFLAKIDKLYFPADERNAINVRLDDKIALDLEVAVLRKNSHDLDQILLEREALALNLADFKKILEHLEIKDLSFATVEREALGLQEDRIVDLVRARKFAEAQKQIDSPEYRKAHAEFGEGVKRFAERLSSDRDRLLIYNQHLTILFLVISIFFLFVAVVFWWRVIVAYRQNQAERAKAEKALEEERARSVQQSKLASLGEMAGSVGHEINNPLAIITGVCEVMILELQKEPLEKKKLLDSAMLLIKTAHRIAKIVKGLRNFCRDGSRDALIECSAEEIIHDTLQLCTERCHSAGIDLSLEEIPPKLTFCCRPTEVSQVILNLISNSIDAIQNLSSPWIRLSVRVAGSNVEIRVTDSGRGIAPAIAERMMEPFFTSKPVGKGTGLGLSVSKKLIENQGGILYWDKNAPNTTFVIRLPLFASEQRVA